MQYNSSRKNVNLELEVIDQLPLTDRLDDEILSPVPYDDYFDLIVSIRSGEQRKNHIDIKSEDIINIYETIGISKDNIPNTNISFMTRLASMDRIMDHFPDYFDFGVNFTLQPSYIINQYKYTKSIHPKDIVWPEGCTNLILIGIPSFMNSYDVLDMILSFPNLDKQYSDDLENLKQRINDDQRNINIYNQIQSNSNNYYDIDNRINSQLVNNSDSGKLSITCEKLGIKKLVNMFTTDDHKYGINLLDNLNDKLIKRPLNMASITFENEENALRFWSNFSSGLFQSYGSVLTCFPDLHGSIIFGEAIICFFSPKMIPTLEEINNINLSVNLTPIKANQEDKFISLKFIYLNTSKDFNLLVESIKNIIPELNTENNHLIDEKEFKLTLTTNNVNLIKKINNLIFVIKKFKDIQNNTVTMGLIYIKESLFEAVMIDTNYILTDIKPNKPIKNQLLNNIDQSVNNDLAGSTFLFKKFEELREALQHDLAPSNEYKDSNLNDLNNNPESYFNKRQKK